MSTTMLLKKSDESANYSTDSEAGGGGRNNIRAADEKDDENSFDKVFVDYGQFKRYQKLLVFLVLLPCTMPNGLHQYDQVYMNFAPDHWCKVEPGIPLPIGDKGPNLTSGCFQYDFGPNNNLYNKNHTRPFDLPLVGCRHGWEFERGAPKTLVSEFELVCDKDFHPTIGLCILQLGNLIGVPIFAFITDKHGRRKSLLIILTLQFVSTFCATFSPTIEVFFALRFLVGVTLTTSYDSITVYALELVGPDYRVLVTVLQCVFFTLGQIITCGLAYLFPGWREISLSTSIITIPLILLMAGSPESPRWQILNDGLKNTHRTFMKIGNFSKGSPEAQKLWTRLEQVQKVEMLELKQEAGYKKGFARLFSTPTMRKKTLLITFEWMTSTAVYVGLGYYGPSIHPDPYIGFFASAAIEFLCYWPARWYMDNIGRRAAFALTFTIGGVASIATVAIPSGNTALFMTSYLISKLAIAAAFLVIYPYAGELYPTELRAVGFSVGSILGAVFSIPIPIVVYMGTEHLSLPLLIFGSLSVLGGFLALLLPETLGKEMPQTLSEADENELTPFWSADCFASLFTIKRK